MSKASELGRKGEELAVEHLKMIGYEILAINWFSHHLEIDIIAKDGDELVIVEVKARGSDSYEHPYEAVSNKKIRFLVKPVSIAIVLPLSTNSAPHQQGSGLCLFHCKAVPMSACVIHAKPSN